ncbi:MAG: Fur family transcriptional regulator [Pseudomonadota bacterium]
MGKRGEKMQAEVLAVLRWRHEPQSAYDVLRVLSEANPKIAPPTIYRALSALEDRGSVRRVESLNAYIACAGDCQHHDSILSICDDCGAVEESAAPDLLKALSRITGKSGFSPARHVIEVHGRCASCAAGKVPA